MSVRRPTLLFLRVGSPSASGRGLNDRKENRLFHHSLSSLGTSLSGAHNDGPAAPSDSADADRSSTNLRVQHSPFFRFRQGVNLHNVRLRLANPLPTANGRSPDSRRSSAATCARFNEFFDVVSPEGTWRRVSRSRCRVSVQSGSREPRRQGVRVAKRQRDGGIVSAAPSSAFPVGPFFDLSPNRHGRKLLVFP